MKKFDAREPFFTISYFVRLKMPRTKLMPHFFHQLQKLQKRQILQIKTDFYIRLYPEMFAAGTSYNPHKQRPQSEKAHI
ncbi:MAG: hypothetical protein DBX55_02345 [Verrucomicrobia bacterium]|nr:MAG: hypothetical protein DBX55_02345 [Verrucomicrobiota bacterium]